MLRSRPVLLLVLLADLMDALLPVLLVDLMEVLLPALLDALLVPGLAWLG